MKLQIKELGAIKEGTIDLSKKLNVFCGPNGTGKTYMAYTIYGLLKNQIHIGSNEEVVKNLIDKKSLNYSIDFDALIEYRKDLIFNFKEEIKQLQAAITSNPNNTTISSTNSSKINDINIKLKEAEDALAKLNVTPPVTPNRGYTQCLFRH
jgi:predicted ATPase